MKIKNMDKKEVKRKMMRKTLISVFTMAAVTWCGEVVAGSILSETELMAIRDESCLIARTVPCGTIFGHGQPCPVTAIICAEYHCVFCDGVGLFDICDEPSETHCCKLISQGSGECGPHREGKCRKIGGGCGCIDVEPIFGGCDKPDYDNQLPPC